MGAKTSTGRLPRRARRKWMPSRTRPGVPLGGQHLTASIDLRRRRQRAVEPVPVEQYSSSTEDPMCGDPISRRAVRAMIS